MTTPGTPPSKVERNEHIARLMAGGMTQVQISERAGVSVRTIRRLQEDPSFRARVRSIRRERALETHARVSALQGEALAALADILRHAETESVRLQAIKLVLDVSHRLEIDDLAEELDADPGQGGWTPDPLPGDDEDDN